jgi:hypothetical protein
MLHHVKASEIGIDDSVRLRFTELYLLDHQTGAEHRSTMSAREGSFAETQANTK